MYSGLPGLGNVCEWLEMVIASPCGDRQTGRFAIGERLENAMREWETRPSRSHDSSKGVAASLDISQQSEQYLREDVKQCQTTSITVGDIYREDLLRINISHGLAVVVRPGKFFHKCQQQQQVSTSIA